MTRSVILLALALLIVTLAAAGWTVDALRACRRWALGERS